jgi:hypothetical protein
MQPSLIALTIALTLVALPVQAQEFSGPGCSDMLVCRTAEVNLQNYWSVPITIRGQSACAQFCSADYWVGHAGTGAVFLQFGHGGAMGPALLAWGVSQGSQANDGFQIRTIVWVSSPNPQFIDDGLYEETIYTWDAAREALVRSTVRPIGPDDRRSAVRELEDNGFRFVFNP